MALSHERKARIYLAIRVTDRGTYISTRRFVATSPESVSLKVTGRRGNALEYKGAGRFDVVVENEVIVILDVEAMQVERL